MEKTKFINKVVKIKGTPYFVEFVDELIGYEGLTNSKEKHIIIENNSDLKEIKKTIVHELFHAFLDECGLVEYSNNELLVTWLENHYFDIQKTLNKILDDNKKVLTKVRTSGSLRTKGKRSPAVNSRLP